MCTQCFCLCWWRCVVSSSVKIVWLQSVEIFSTFPFFCILFTFYITKYGPSLGHIEEFCFAIRLTSTCVQDLKSGCIYTGFFRVTRWHRHNVRVTVRTGIVDLRERCTLLEQLASSKPYSSGDLKVDEFA